MSYAKNLCLVATVVLALSSVLCAMPGERTYVSGNFFLMLDGVKCGFVKSVDGGAIVADVVNERAGADYFVKKHIGQPTYEEFTLQVGFSMTKQIYEWIGASWTAPGQRKTGSIVALDRDLTPKSERNFTEALITETTIPAMDGSSKEPAYITVKFSPRVIRNVAAGGDKAEYGQYGKNEQKVWLPASFRLDIPGLDCTKVNKIEPFTVKTTVVTNNTGDARDQAKEPGKIEFPNLKITLAEATAQSWIDWHKSFVIDGKNDDQSEKEGSLMMLSANGEKVLARINFYHMGICSLVPDKAEANADQIKRVTVELYVERMEFLFGDKAGPAPSSAPASTPSSTPTPAPTTKPTGTTGARRG